MRHFTPLFLLVLLLPGCQRNPPQPVREYQMRGEVVSIDPSSQTATVKHGNIEGWMEAMTMEYPIHDKQEFAKVKVGGKIQAKILVQGHEYWIATVTEDASK